MRVIKLPLLAKFRSEEPEIRLQPVFNRLEPFLSTCHPKGAQRAIFLHFAKKIAKSRKINRFFCIWRKKSSKTEKSHIFACFFHFLLLIATKMEKDKENELKMVFFCEGPLFSDKSGLFFAFWPLFWEMKRGSKNHPKMTRSDPPNGGSRPPQGPFWPPPGPKSPFRCLEVGFGGSKRGPGGEKPPKTPSQPYGDTSNHAQKS